MIYLETDRLILRDYEEADFADYCRLKMDCFRNADLAKYKDSMRPLIEKDMAETEKALTAWKTEK